MRALEPVARLRFLSSFSSVTNIVSIQLSKQQVSPNGEPIAFPTRVAMAAVAGCLGGFIGTPGDMVNVRMQNDIKLPPEKRRK
jgi:dicarboxylate transporter 10